MKQIYLGAAYYPEMWPAEEVEEDIKRCKRAGINTLRIGEFAWKKMEPSEGVFDFAWLKQAVDKLYENGIHTVMCTPSATPPRWLMNKYEETRMVMHDLIRADVSSRCHTCKTSLKMREKNRIIVTELAKNFGHHPGVIGWQIDNEIFPYSGGCFCENCKKAFRVHLQKQYGTIEKLNQEWGMARWSLTYNSFDEIEPPYPNQWKHPSLSTAWHKFQCKQIYSYVNEQAEILHQYTSVPIGTNLMQQDLLDYYEVNEHLDVIQYNHYDKESDLPLTVFGYDFLRPIKDRPFWIMETQVGWNGSEYAENGYRSPGNCYVNTWLPIAKGGEMNLYWLFRTHPNGHELAHGALFSTAGRMYRETEEVQKLAKDFEKCAEFLTGSKVEAKIALHYSHTAAVNFKNAPILKGFNYRDALMSIYDAFRHFNVDVIDTAHELEWYEVLVSPFTTTLDENGFKERVLKWIYDGGTWIVGPMSDIMNGNTSKYIDSPYSFVEDLAGVYTKYQKPVHNDVFKAKWKDGGACEISQCYDGYECMIGTESLASYAGDEFDGLSVITERKIGKGKVVLVGSKISSNDMLRLINKAPIAEASNNVILVERTGAQSGIIALETEHEDGTINVEGNYTNLLTGEKVTGCYAVKPYEVVVLKKGE